MSTSLVEEADARERRYAVHSLREPQFGCGPKCRAHDPARDARDFTVCASLVAPLCVRRSAVALNHEIVAPLDPVVLELIAPRRQQRRANTRGPAEFHGCSVPIGPHVLC